jgi:hypothetical protein
MVFKTVGEEKRDLFLKYFSFNKQSEEENVSSYCENFSEIKTLRDQPFNLQVGGGVMVFCFIQKRTF